MFLNAKSEPMNEQQEKTINEFLEKMKNMMVVKGNDYSGTEDTLLDLAKALRKKEGR